jgi:hypothetical protein
MSCTSAMICGCQAEMSSFSRVDSIRTSCMHHPTSRARRRTMLRKVPVGGVEARSAGPGMPRVLVEVVASKGATVLRATPESSPVLRQNFGWATIAKRITSRSQFREFSYEEVGQLSSLSRACSGKYLACLVMGDAIVTPESMLTVCMHNCKRGRRLTEGRSRSACLFSRCLQPITCN